MSEFKFACPICGQHITAASSASGTQLECPTCFQKIIVPQAPASEDSKYILSATQVGKPRPSQSGVNGDLAPLERSRGVGISIASVLLLLVLAGGAASAYYLWQHRSSYLGIRENTVPTNPPAPLALPSPPASPYSIPTQFCWRLDLTNAAIPDTIAAGSIHGLGFQSERATLQGGNLTLRQGRDWPPDLGITVSLPVWQGEQWSGKTVEIKPDLASAPRITLRWKDDAGKAVNKNFSNGYFLKLTFGAAANNRMPGRLFLSLPDEAHSFVAGSFTAEIRKPPPPKPPRSK